MPNELFLILKTHSPLLCYYLYILICLLIQPPLHSFNNLFHLSKWSHHVQVIKTGSSKVPQPPIFASEAYLLSTLISFHGATLFQAPTEVCTSSAALHRCGAPACIGCSVAMCKTHLISGFVLSFQKVIL